MSKYQKVNWKKKLDFLLFGWLVNWAYPEYYRPKYGYKSYRKIILYNFISQKILGINRKTPWPVHFTSIVRSPEKIQKGILCDPGDNIGVYIQAVNGIILGNNVGISPGCKIISANHNVCQHSKHDTSPPIIIGNNVFIFANSVVLPGVKIGDNVTIGAGSVVVKDIPSNSIAVGNPCRVIKAKEPYAERFEAIEFNRKIPENLRKYFSSY
ncbi:acyltransferase [Moheibacter lacus]|uniref:Acetyltransferase n=1 Tax=Moheibacter lacus TaxID=2745851 RepID=A0A838ZG96_9FLAO|nr:DapH/DapD/GlmU-related protein [Moheibacter lacus]MBA5628731.1 acyltransferase [Moheibacter lacus]